MLSLIHISIRKELPDFFKTIQFNTVLNPKHNYENIKEYFQTDEIVADATLMHTLVEENDSSTNIDFRKEFTRSREYDLSLIHIFHLPVSAASLRFSLSGQAPPVPLLPPYSTYICG